MMYNPVKIPEGKGIFTIYPELKKYKAFRASSGSDLDNRMVMLWIMCVYDKNTPYRAKYKDILKRKIEAAHDVGFPMQETGIFDDAVEEFMRGRNSKVNDKILEYIRLHRSFKYAYFVAIENSYYSMLAEVMEGKTIKIAGLKEIGNELEETLTEILNDEDNPHMKEAFLRYVEEDRLGLRPEDIALKLANDEQPVTYKEIL